MPNTQLTKQDLIDTLMLLSALESWSFSTKTDLPDYLLERLSDTIDKFRTAILEEVK